jgi:signal transduction histidine kinase
MATTPEPRPADADAAGDTSAGDQRVRALLQRVAALDAEVAWEFGLHLDSLTESEKELQVRVGALEETNRQLQERLTSEHREYAQLRASMDELLNLHELSEAISTSFDVSDILDQLMSLSGRVVPFDGAGVFSLVEDGAGLEAISLRGAGELLQERVRKHWDDGIVDWVLRESRPIVIDDLESSDGHTFVFVPLRVRGKQIGLYALHCPKPKDEYTRSEINMLGVLANQAAAAMENSRLYTDVETAHERLKEQQRQLLLSARQAAIGELAGGVAHEVNNPLQIILSRVQLMVSQQTRAPEQDPKMMDGLALIENNVKRISRIIRALLGFAEHNTIEAEGQPFSVAAAIQQACALTRHQLDQHRIDIDVCVEADLPDAFGSVGELEQVFINLLLNAENAMVGAGGHLAIDARREGEWLEVRFQDDGPGIQPQHMGRIFEPFFTTRSDRGGTGLGLAVCYRIVENHGGTITVESEPGEGACFIIRLPIPDSDTVPPEPSEP